MYQIENKSDIFVEHYTGWKRVYTIDRIGNEQDLIAYLAYGFHPELLACNFNEECRFNERFHKHYFDGYGRDIAATAFKDDAWAYYCKYLRNKKFQGKSKQTYWRKKYNYHNVFRKTPIPYTGKIKGGPNIRPHRIKHIKAMYDNPEYKGFNRGSKKDYPDGWWDDWFRSRDRNWKKQSKRRHQWKGDVIM